MMVEIKLDQLLSLGDGGGLSTECKGTQGGFLK